MNLKKLRLSIFPINRSVTLFVLQIAKEHTKCFFSFLYKSINYIKVVKLILRGIL